MNSVRTRYLLQKVLRWLWLAVLIGALLALGYYLLHARRAPEPADAVAPAEAETLPEEDPRLLRFALYAPVFTPGESENGLDEYALSVANFAAARLQTDLNCYQYFDQIYQRYPALDPHDFTYTDLRNMLSAWQFNYDVVVRVQAPELTGSALESCAAAMGVLPQDQQITEQAHAAALDQTRCLLRDLVFEAVTAKADDPAFLSDAGVTLVRGDAHYEAIMDQQSLILTEAEESTLLDDVAAGSKPLSKKMLALVFFIGAMITEMVVLAFALMDDTIRTAEDLTQNTDLSVLSVGSADDAAVAEAALKLLVRRASPGSLLLAPVGTDAQSASPLAAALTASMRRASERAGEPALGAGEVLVAEDVTAWNEALASVLGRSAVVLVRAGKTHCRDLQKAAEVLHQLDVPVIGAMLIDR